MVCLSYESYPKGEVVLRATTLFPVFDLPSVAKLSERSCSKGTETYGTERFAPPWSRFRWSVISRISL